MENAGFEPKIAVHFLYFYTLLVVSKRYKVSSSNASGHEGLGRRSWEWTGKLLQSNALKKILTWSEQRAKQRRYFLKYFFLQKCLEQKINVDVLSINRAQVIKTPFCECAMPQKCLLYDVFCDASLGQLINILASADAARYEQQQQTRHCFSSECSHIWKCMGDSGANSW